MCEGGLGVTKTCGVAAFCDTTRLHVLPPGRKYIVTQ